MRWPAGRRSDVAQPTSHNRRPARSSRGSTQWSKAAASASADGTIAFYAPDTYCIVVPPSEAFFEPINRHRTALHELGHAIGARHRLDRDLSGRIGSKRYAFEELVAELNAAFCYATLGVVPTVRHADYIGAWLKVLREDNRAIVRAASQASKAADYLLGFAPAETAAIAKCCSRREASGLGASLEAIGPWVRRGERTRAGGSW